MRRIALFASVALILAGGFAVAHASGRLYAQALAESRREAQQSLLRSERFERQAGRATSEAQRARAEAEALAARIQAAEADLTAGEARIAIIAALQARQRARIAERQGPVVRLTGALQTMARRPAALALVQPGSVQDAVHVRTLLAAVLPEIRRRTASLRAEVERSDALRRRSEGAREALLASREELKRRRVALASFEARQRARSQQLAGLAISESDRALALGEEARTLARIVGTRQYQAQLEASLAQLPGPVPRPGSAATADARTSPLDYRLPVEGRLIVGVGEISDGGVHARGLTFETEPEARVIAPANGRVIYAAPFRSYGHVVILDHGRGWSSVITDLGRIDVATGQRVRRGALLGRAGEQETRVSVELRRNGRPVPIAQLVAG